MARDRLTFRQRDVTAAIKAVEAAGHHVARVEIGQDGRIIVIVACAAAEQDLPRGEEHWERLK